MSSSPGLTLVRARVVVRDVGPGVRCGIVKIGGHPIREAPREDGISAHLPPRRRHRGAILGRGLVRGVPSFRGLLGQLRPLRPRTGSDREQDEYGIRYNAPKKTAPKDGQLW